MDPDQPIQKHDQDEFERSSFASHLADSLLLEKDAPSIVIGLEGSWGAGKTSCINLIVEDLTKKKSKPIIVVYSPWLISTIDSVIEGFFLELAASIGLHSKADSARKASHKLLQFGKMLAPIKMVPGIEPWGTIVETVLSSVGNATKAASELGNLSLLSRKDDLEKHLAKINRPIVAIIDDVDRLSPEHIRIVFQMVKAICNFKRVSYLIAYDPGPVKKALEYKKTYDGAKYLEKIVPLSYPLPRTSFTNIKDFFKKHVYKLADRYSLTIENDDKILFEKALNTTDLVRAFETPRDVIRLCNRLKISVPNISNEVSFADIVVFETLCLKYKELNDIIRNEPDRFVSIRGFDSELSPRDGYVVRQQEIRAMDTEQHTSMSWLFEKLNYDERKRNIIESLLLFLFPYLNGHVLSRDEYALQSIRRLSDRHAFLKVLHCGLTSFTYSQRQVERFFENPDERRNIIVEYINANDLFNWVSYILEIAINSDIKDLIQLCDIFLEELNGPQTEESNYHISQHVGEFLYHIIISRNDKMISWDMLDRLTSSSVSLSVSEFTLLQLLRDYGIWKKGEFFADQDVPNERSDKAIVGLNIFSCKQLYQAKDQWLESVRRASKSENILQTQKSVLSILFRWGQLNNNDFVEPQTYVMNASEDPEWLRSFLELFDTFKGISDLVTFIPDGELDGFIGKVEKLSNGKNDDSDEHINQIVESLKSSKNEE